MTTAHRAPPPLLSRWRALWFPLWALVWTVISFSLGIVLLLMAPRSGRFTHWTTRLWAFGLLAGQGLFVRTHGRAHVVGHGSRVWVVNHTSFLDPPTMAVATQGPIRFVLKRELRRMPFVGWYAALAGHFFVDRRDARQGRDLQERAIQAMVKHHLCPIVFPEGTRSATGALGSFRAGAFELAVRTGAPLQPVWISGARERMPRGASWPRRGGTIQAFIGPAIPMVGLAGSAGRREAARLTRVALESLAAAAGETPRAT